MNRNDLRRVDLNLLIVFETLMHEKSVTRAAEKLFLGQPAISAAEPTARATEIFGLLSPALDSISTAVSRASEFDPATSTSVFEAPGNCIGGQAGQLHPDAAAAGLGRNFGRRQLTPRTCPPTPNARSCAAASLNSCALTRFPAP